MFVYWLFVLSNRQGNLDVPVFQKLVSTLVLVFDLRNRQRHLFLFVIKIKKAFRLVWILLCSEPINDTLICECFLFAYQKNKKTQLVGNILSVL